MAISLRGTCTSPSRASGTRVFKLSRAGRCERLGSCNRGLDELGTRHSLYKFETR